MAIKEKTMEILKMSRTTDICDALDSMGLQDLYVMDPALRPLIPMTKFCGPAVTCEYDRTDEKIPCVDYEFFEKKQYWPKDEEGFLFIDNKKFNRDELMEMADTLVKVNPGEVVVCACHGLIGAVYGSNAAGDLLEKGMAGMVVDGSYRDTEESVLINMPVFATTFSYVHPQGRIQGVSANKPVVCAGVLVNPGDVICADNDGVIVVPQNIADEVAYRAYRIQQVDRPLRRKIYERMGKPFDETVELLPDIERWF